MKRALNGHKISCGRCLARHLFEGVLPPTSLVHRHFSSEVVRDLPSTIPPAGHAHLTNRALISLIGQDASRFLQGLTTANIQPSSVTSSNISASNNRASYSAFLNAQGRLLHDVFIYHITNLSTPGFSPFCPNNESFLIEVDATEQDHLFRWLKRYQLRSKISLRVLDSEECSVWSCWNNADSPPITAKPPSQKDSDDCTGMAAIFPDLRAPGFGYRLLVPQTPGHLSIASGPPSAASLGLRSHSEYSTLTQYTIRRYLYGIPEGQIELPSESALLQESCLDYMGGVDFRKGCYVGQELVIRTQHTGVVRKRILPFLLNDNTHLANRMAKSGSEAACPALEYNAIDARRISGKVLDPLVGAEIYKVDGSGRRVAKCMGGIGNVGLALWRLQVLEGTFGIKCEAIGSGEFPKANASTITLTPFIPRWWNERKKSISTV